jgi:hypothetical protein
MRRTLNQIANAYFHAWQAGDLDTLRSILADAVELGGPLANLASWSTIDTGRIVAINVTFDPRAMLRGSGPPDTGR